MGKRITCAMCGCYEEAPYHLHKSVDDCIKAVERKCEERLAAERETQEKRIEELEQALDHALRQWALHYSFMTEHDIVDGKDPEAETYLYMKGVLKHQSSKKREFVNEPRCPKCNTVLAWDGIAEKTWCRECGP